MNWDLIIDHNRSALLRLVAALFASMGLASGGSVVSVPRHVRAAVLLVLRPAESATRRLIVVIEYLRKREGMTVSAGVSRAVARSSTKKRSGSGSRSLPLFDPRKRFDAISLRRRYGPGPRMTFIGDENPSFEEKAVPGDDDEIGATRLSQRLQALQRALEDLPKQAERLARLRLRQQRRAKGGFKSPLRAGWPPGHRARPKHEIDEVLKDCHWLAVQAEAANDTS